MEGREGLEAPRASVGQVQAHNAMVLDVPYPVDEAGRLGSVDETDDAVVA
jgi:hypothetical protein